MTLILGLEKQLKESKDIISEERNKAFINNLVLRNNIEENVKLRQNIDDTNQVLEKTTQEYDSCKLHVKILQARVLQLEQEANESKKVPYFLK